MDFLFIVIIKDCSNLRYWLYVSSFYMVANLIFPIFMLLKMVRLSKKFQHTMPYMESNNFLTFLRENMLLATVIDSFCINNTVEFSKYRIVFGRLMGGLSFFLQDFPQFTLHAFFKLYPLIVSDYDPVHYYLKKQSLLLISMIISGLAVAISFFNMIMCVENEFDPLLVEDALLNRRIENKQKREEEERLQKDKNRLKKV